MTSPAGADNLDCGGGNDRSFGGGGADLIYDALDGGGDLINGGGGRDDCRGDPGDTYRKCEEIS